MWYIQYKDDLDFERTAHPHVPDVLTENGLKDIMAIGNILELATVIDRRCYRSTSLPSKEREEMGLSRSMYRRLQSIIAQKFIVHVQGKPISPFMVFRRSLVEFAAAVVVYKQDREKEVVKIPLCPSTKVKEKMVLFFELNFPELLPRLHLLIDSRTEYLYWTGPKISITKRTIGTRQATETPTPSLFETPWWDFPDSPNFPDHVSQQPVPPTHDVDDLEKDGASQLEFRSELMGMFSAEGSSESRSKASSDVCSYWPFCLFELMSPSFSSAIVVNQGVRSVGYLKVQRSVVFV
jgi:hypothetical protein